MKTVRILIADDHDIVREGLITLLATRTDFRVCGEAATGREAVAKARELKPHVVVLDFSMPELNGVEATRQIRAALPGTEVLILTMHDSETLAHEVLTAGARGFLLKTHAKQQIVATVDALAQQRPFFTKNLSADVLDAFLRPAKTLQKHPLPPAGSRRASARSGSSLPKAARARTSRSNWD